MQNIITKSRSRSIHSSAPFSRVSPNTTIPMRPYELKEALWDEWDREKKYMTQIKILKDKIEKNHKKGRINRSRSNKTKKTPKRGSTEKENYLKGEKLLSGRNVIPEKNSNILQENEAARIEILELQKENLSMKEYYDNIFNNYEKEIQSQRSEKAKKIEEVKTCIKSMTELTEISEKLAAEKLKLSEKLILYKKEGFGGTGSQLREKLQSIEKLNEQYVEQIKELIGIVDNQNLQLEIYSNKCEESTKELENLRQVQNNYATFGNQKEINKFRTLIQEYENKIGELEKAIESKDYLVNAQNEAIQNLMKTVKSGEKVIQIFWDEKTYTEQSLDKLAKVKEFSDCICQTRQTLDRSIEKGNEEFFSSLDLNKNQNQDKILVQTSGRMNPLIEIRNEMNVMENELGLTSQSPFLSFASEIENINNEDRLSKLKKYQEIFGQKDVKDQKIKISENFNCPTLG